MRCALYTTLGLGVFGDAELAGIRRLEDGGQDPLVPRRPSSQCLATLSLDSFCFSAALSLVPPFDWGCIQGRVFLFVSERFEAVGRVNKAMAVRSRCSLGQCRARVLLHAEGCFDKAVDASR